MRSFNTFLLASFLLFFPLFSHAAITDWQKGAIIVPHSTEDFASPQIRESMMRLKETGANYVGLVIPWYQSNLYSTEIFRSWNTPSDNALGAAIDTAHSLGLKVYLKVHIESESGEWRANINPNVNRDQWFRNYESVLRGVAAVAEAHNAEMLSVGTELVRMASDTTSADNTTQWKRMIGTVRGIYHGQLTYGANATASDWSEFSDEKRHIKFWSDLDVVSLSPYYNLDYGSNDVATIKRAWDDIRKNDLQPFQAQVGKPILFGEIGYRSIEGSYRDPWNWERWGWPDETTQANAYRALMDYWKDYSFFAGVEWWQWDINVNAGGGNDNGYTPQNKMAEQVMKEFFTSTAQPSPEASNLTFQGTSRTGSVGQSLTLSSSVSNSGAGVNEVILDFELYDPTNTRVLQKIFENESFGSGEVKNYSFEWTPSTPGNHTLRGGAFGKNWTPLLHWNNDILTITVDSSGDTPPPSGAIDIWWPTDGVQVAGSLPLKALLQGQQLSEYDMFWQVDGDIENLMGDSMEDWPHKESWIDVSGWMWKQGGPYTLTFIAKTKSGTVLASKSVQITVAH